MRQTATQLEKFYASPLGSAARDMVSRRLNALWPDLAGKNVLGYGYAWPYLVPYDAGTNRLTLSELYRVLAPEGRIVVICANRSGMWARAESLPFGAGRPYSRRQLKDTLRIAKFTPTVSANALYIPPVRACARPSILRGAERFGETVWPGFSGLVLVEAIKRLYAPSEIGHGQKVARPKFAGVPALNQTRFKENNVNRSDV